MPEIHLAIMVILEGLDFLIRKHVNRINPDDNTLTVEILAQPIVNEYLSFRAEGKGSFREKAGFKVFSRTFWRKKPGVGCSQAGAEIGA